MLETVAAYDMLCPKCRSGTCVVINLTRKYESLLNSIDKELLLPSTELGILRTLESEKSPMFASEIASELDCSYQLVGKRGRTLAERQLVSRDEIRTPTGMRRQFQITDAARAAYFNHSETDKVAVSNQDETSGTDTRPRME